MAFTKQLFDYLFSGTALVAVDTYEKDRCIGDIEKGIQTHNDKEEDHDKQLNFFVWSAATGWLKPDGKEVFESKGVQTDPHLAPPGIIAMEQDVDSRAIFITAAEYTKPAIAVCKEALQKTIIALCTLQEIVNLLEKEIDLYAFLKEKIDCSVIDKNPYKIIIRNKFKIYFENFYNNFNNS